MKKNFSIHNDSIGIQTATHYLDIHNNYNFHSLHYNNIDDEVELIFQKCKGEWVKNGEPEELVISFQGVNHFETSSNFFNNRSDTVEEIGYKAPGDNDYDWLLREEQADSESHILFRMENGEYIRISASDAIIRSE